MQAKAGGFELMRSAALLVAVGLTWSVAVCATSAPKQHLAKQGSIGHDV